MANILYPPVSYHFLVRFLFENQGGAKGFFDKAPSPNDFRFQEVSGLAATVEYDDIREGGENVITYSLPKAVKQDKLSLKRGMLSGSRVVEWVRDAVEEFTFTTVEVQVVLLDQTHLPIAAWQFDRVFPVSWNLSSFNAMDNAYVVESLELRYSEFRAITIPFEDLIK